jgi:hypothetical protein
VGGERGRRDDVEADGCGEELELVSVMLVRCSEDAEGSSSGAFDEEETPSGRGLVCGRDRGRRKKGRLTSRKMML